MGNVNTMRSVAKPDDRGSLLFNDQLRRYTSLPVEDADEAPVAIVVTDVVGSSERWREDDVQMVGALCQQNGAMRSLLEQLNALYPDCTLLKVNEIGDSWVVVARGPRCGTVAAHFAVAAQQRSRLPMRVGLHCGEFAMVRLNRYDAQGFVPLQYECFGLSREVLSEVKQIEARSGTGEVAASQAFRDQLEREGGCWPPRPNPELRGTVDAVEPLPLAPGWLLFVAVRSGRVQLLEAMCEWGKRQVWNAEVQAVSLEDEGRVWNLVGHDDAAVAALLHFLFEELEWTHCKASVVWANRLWMIHDRSDDPFQQFVRYVSQDQNVAARLLHRADWGTLVSNEAAALERVCPDHDRWVEREVTLKGVGSMDVWAVQADPADAASWLALLRCGF